jgi:Rrf2 family protein
VKLTTKSEYGLLALVYLARHQESEFCKIEDICSKYNIPKKYLEQLFTILKSAKFIKTRRGSNGGYSLNKPADKVSVAEIIRLMDGALAPTSSVSEFFFAHSPLEQEHKLTEIMRDIRNYIAKKLENLTIKDLL